jgi:hypothetical protein
MPVDANELERLRRKQGGLLCSVRSLVCCLSVLVGRPPLTTSRSKNSKSSRRQQEVVRSYENDDDSFGYNFDEQISPRVMTRLATSSDHNFN